MSRSKIARLESRVETLGKIVDLHNLTIEAMLRTNELQRRTIDQLISSIRELNNVSRP
jgi:hypothetical protein